MINCLQILVLMNLFVLAIPLNADMVMTMILGLCSLEFIPTDALMEYFYFHETEPYKSDVDGNDEERSKYFLAGYDSSNFIQLLGPMMIFIVLYILNSIWKCLMKRCINRCGCGNNRCSNYWRKDVLHSVIVLRFLLEGCIEIGLSALITVKMLDENSFGTF